MLVSSVQERHSSLRSSSFFNIYGSQLPAYVTLIIAPLTRATNPGMHSNYFRFYNTERPHQALGYRTPAEVFTSIPVEATANGGMVESLTLDTLVTAGPLLTWPLSCPNDGDHLSP